MSSDPQVLITGAGPTGLVLALWLTRLGVRVRIIDKTAEPGTTSRAVGIAARTLELYRHSGLAEALVAAGVIVPAVNLWVRGEHRAQLTLRHMGEGLTPFPYMLIYPQDAHERLLIARLAELGVEVERRTELVRFEQTADTVRYTLRRIAADADGNGAAGAAIEETGAAAYLAGCDGARSTVREALGTGFPGGTYEHLFYVADADTAGPAANGQIHVDLEEADFLAVFPLKTSGRVRLIGAVSKRADDPTPLTFDDVGRRVIDNMRFTIHQVNWFSTYHVHHRVASHFRDGRAFLLGDAAHVHSPVGGQGMNTGIGDAINLAWKLAAVLNAGSDPALLETYEQERIGFARRLVATTDRIFTFVSQSGRFAQFVRTRIAPLVLPRLFRFAATRRFLFGTVSQIGIQYRTSPLSEGSAGGRIRGGDRLPWTPTSDGRDNFTPLDSLSWRVQVYGTARPDAASVCSELGIALDVFAWQETMKTNGLMRDALYLVRPDGYLAAVIRNGAAERLQTYFASRKLASVVCRGRASDVG